MEEHQDALDPEQTDMNTSVFSNISSYSSFNTNDSMSEVSFDSTFNVNINVANQLSKFIKNKLDYNLPLTCLEKNIKVRNETPGVKVILPETKYKIRKESNLKFEYERYYECLGCKNYTVDNESRLVSHLDCQYCDRNIVKTLQNFFTYIPLQQQLKNSIQKNWLSILDYKQKERDEQYVGDVDDGLICQKMNKKFPHTFNLSLVLNTDGAQVFKSSRKSLWPVQLYQNYLHPRVRYVASNVIVVGLYFGCSKPDPKHLLFPLITELKSIQEAGGFRLKHLKSEEHTFMPFILHGVFDLPAKAMCQGLVQYNGMNACGYCHHPGVKIKNKTKNEKNQVTTMYRYIYRGVEEKSRTHENTLEALQKLIRNKLFDCDGFRKLSPLIGLLDFDMINGFGIDYLHCVYLGVVPRLVKYWLDPKNSREPYYIKKKDILNVRILSIKPPCTINRKPRSIYDREYYKGNEWRSHALYYLRYSLPGVLDSRYIQHFELLSAAIYKLSQKEISLEEIDEAEIMLFKFANDFESLYGKNEVTMNLHLLRHLASAVRYSGPLWSQAMFAFEQSNGDLVRSVTSKSRVLYEITENYILRNSLEMKTEDFRHKLDLCQKYKSFSPSAEQIALFMQHDILLDLSTIWKSIKLNGESFTSIAYKATIKSIDYCVQFHDDQIGHILYYVCFNGVVYALVNILDVIEKKHQFRFLESTNLLSVRRVDKLTEKLIFMKLGGKQIACRFPNNYEKT